MGLRRRERGGSRRRRQFDGRGQWRRLDDGFQIEPILEGFDGRQETIAQTGSGFDKPRALGRIAEGVPKFVDGLVQIAVDVGRRFLGPKAVAQFLAGDESARLFKKSLKNIERLVLKLYADTALSKLPRIQVNLEDAETEGSTRCYVRHSVTGVITGPD